MPTADKIHQALTCFQAEKIDLQDLSHRHANHPGAASGSHFSLLIVTEYFRGQSRITRHQQIYKVLQELMQTEIHALAITALTPEERATQKTNF